MAQRPQLDPQSRADLAVDPAPARISFGQHVSSAQVSELDGAREPPRTITDPQTLQVDVAGSAVAVALRLP